MEMLLPTHGDFDMHYTAANQVRVLPSYELDSEERTLHITDPAWGKCEIGKDPGDQVFIELFTNPLIQRMANIEQLTLPQRFTTMPGSYDFTRFEHLWGSVVFVRKMLEQYRANGQEISAEDATKLQLRTFVSDLGHTAYSHLGDWLFQGFGGSEDQHDDELKDLLEVGGVTEIIERHGYDIDEVVFPDVQDWIECDSPDLCVDRVDYGAREMLRWVTGYESSGEWLGRFNIVDDQIVMSDKQSARNFALAFGLLATEHWGQPVHRLQLNLFGELVRGVITDERSSLIWGHSMMHPRDILYTIDSVITNASRAVGTVNHDLHELLISTGRSQRKIFAHGRSAELSQFLIDTSERPWRPTDDKDIKFPHPLKSLSWHTEYTHLKPYGIEIVPVDLESDVESFGEQRHTLDIYLPALKPRTVDPLYFEDNGEVVRLTDKDELSKRLLAECREIQKQAYVARYHGDPNFLDEIKRKMEYNQAEWSKMLHSERADKDKMREMLRDAGTYAIVSSGLRMSYY
jgi:hypothetical protein